MLRSLSYGILRNVRKYLQQNNINIRYRHRTCLFIASELLVTTQIRCMSIKVEQRTKIDIENGLTKACEEGDDAIISLLDQLKDFVTVVSREYRSCLVKQIEITETASNVGPLSEMWDKLPEYRTLANELNKELDEYMTVFNTIGQMSSDESLISFVTGSSEKLELIALKYKELDVLLQKEFAENREIELKLLRVNRDSILKGVN